MKKNSRTRKPASRRDVLPKGMRNTPPPMVSRGRDPRGLAGVMLVAMVVGAAGLFHVWTRSETLSLGYRIAAQEARIRAAESEQSRLNVEVASLSSPTRIAHLATTHLGLRAPDPGQVIDLGNAAPSSGQTVAAVEPGLLHR